MANPLHHLATEERMNRRRLRKVWEGMMRRCYNQSSKSFKSYGGRGIKVSECWHSFESFCQDMGLRPDGMSLDRINVNGDYGPANCRWATRSQQQNNKRDHYLITWMGETMNLTQWSTRVGIPYQTLLYRLNHQWPIHLAMSDKRMAGKRGIGRKGEEWLKHYRLQDAEQALGVSR